MYLPAHFEEKRPEVLHELLRAHPLGLLVTQDAAGAMAANTVPFVLDADPAGGPGILRAHVARANPLWRSARGDLDSLVVFQGEQAYISPSFYASKAEHGKVVPTWNYVMVQARGRLRAIDDTDWLRAFVTRLTDRHEAPRAQPWAVSDAPEDYIATMLRAIVGIEIVLTSLTGKWKVGQNRSAADRAGVAQGLADAGIRFEASSAPPVPAPDRT
ncbi:MAG: FMN-binding negative transcriptional regulator [Pseudomonadota bacterium]